MQDEPLAYCRGQFVPFSQAAVPLSDWGFVLGVTVSEQLRTFSGKLFRPVDHWERLRRSAALVGSDPGFSNAEWTALCDKLIAQNYPLLPPGGDLGVVVLITPGDNATFAGRPSTGPHVYLHTYPIPFTKWAREYETGTELVPSTIAQVPNACWPAELKCRSRMHYYLADADVARRSPGARALLLDGQGSVIETSTANIVVVRETATGPECLSPPRNTILPGITLGVTQELISTLGWTFREQTLRPADLLLADEVWLTSTTFCVLPATRFAGYPVGDGPPGPRWQQLMVAWQNLVGLDVIAQAQHCLH